MSIKKTKITKALGAYVLGGTASGNVIKDAVNTYADLMAIDTSTLTPGNNFVVKQDETHGNATTFYQWNGTAFIFTGYVNVNLDSLSNRYFSTTNLPLNPSQATLTNIWEAASTLLISGVAPGQIASLVDSNSGLIYSYYGNSQTWYIHASFIDAISTVSVNSNLNTTVNIDYVKKNVITGAATNASLALPVATSTSAGVASKETIQEVEESAAEIIDIKALIPNQATPSNQLADKDFVNSSISTLSARPIQASATGDAFATFAALVAGPWFSKGVSTTPDEFDYAMVLTDETMGNSTTRYTYDGVVWSFQFIVQITPFTAAQLQAINSNVTSGKVLGYDSHINSKTNPHDVQYSQLLNKPDLTIYAEKATTYTKTETDTNIATETSRAINAENNLADAIEVNADNIALKEDLINKSNDIAADSGSIVKYPTVKAVEDAVELIKPLKTFDTTDMVIAGLNSPYKAIADIVVGKNETTSKILAILNDTELLAKGFTTPVDKSTGPTDEIFLRTYLCDLGAGDDLSELHNSIIATDYYVDGVNQTYTTYGVYRLAYNEYSKAELVVINDKVYLDAYYTDGYSDADDQGLEFTTNVNLVRLNVDVAPEWQAKMATKNVSGNTFVSGTCHISLSETVEFPTNIKGLGDRDVINLGSFRLLPGEDIPQPINSTLFQPQVGRIITIDNITLTCPLNDYYYSEFTVFNSNNARCLITNSIVANIIALFPQDLALAKTNLAFENSLIYNCDYLYCMTLDTTRLRTFAGKYGAETSTLNVVMPVTSSYSNIFNAKDCENVDFRIECIQDTLITYSVPTSKNLNISNCNYCWFYLSHASNFSGTSLLYLKAFVDNCIDAELQLTDIFLEGYNINNINRSINITTGNKLTSCSILENSAIGNLYVNGNFLSRGSTCRLAPVGIGPLADISAIKTTPTKQIFKNSYMLSETLSVPSTSNILSIRVAANLSYVKVGTKVYIGDEVGTVLSVTAPNKINLTAPLTQIYPASTPLLIRNVDAVLPVNLVVNTLSLETIDKDLKITMSPDVVQQAISIKKVSI